VLVNVVDQFGVADFSLLKPLLSPAVVLFRGKNQQLLEQPAA